MDGKKRSYDAGGVAANRGRMIAMAHCVRRQHGAAPIFVLRVVHWSRICCSDAAVKASFLKKSAKL